MKWNAFTGMVAIGSLLLLACAVTGDTGHSFATMPEKALHPGGTDAMPEADFEAVLYDGSATPRILFLFNGSQGDGPATFAWDFGDGSDPSAETNPVHEYNGSGEYVVSLRVTDADGDWSACAYIVSIGDQQATVTFTSTVSFNPWTLVSIGLLAAVLLVYYKVVPGLKRKKEETREIVTKEY